MRRFSISMPDRLVRKLDEMLKERGYANRSQAVASLVRDRLVEQAAESGRGEIAGTITLVYDHHKANLQSLLTAIQHDHHEQIVSTVHVHLDHDNCLEVLVVRGAAAKVRRISDRLISAKGIKHGRLTVTTTGRDLG